MLQITPKNYTGHGSITAVSRWRARCLCRSFLGVQETYTGHSLETVEEEVIHLAIPTPVTRIGRDTFKGGRGNANTWLTSDIQNRRIEKNGFVF